MHVSEDPPTLPGSISMLANDLLSEPPAMTFGSCVSFIFYLFTHLESLAASGRQGGL
jgi:hypothetical protein